MHHGRPVSAAVSRPDRVRAVGTVVAWTATLALTLAATEARGQVRGASFNEVFEDVFPRLEETLDRTEQHASLPKSKLFGEDQGSNGAASASSWTR